MYRSCATPLEPRVRQHADDADRDRPARRRRRRRALAGDARTRAPSLTPAGMRTSTVRSVPSLGDRRARRVVPGERLFERQIDGAFDIAARAGRAARAAPALRPAACAAEERVEEIGERIAVRRTSPAFLRASSCGRSRRPARRCRRSPTSRSTGRRARRRRLLVQRASWRRARRTCGASPDRPALRWLR